MLQLRHYSSCQFRQLTMENSPQTTHQLQKRLKKRSILGLQAADKGPQLTPVQTTHHCKTGRGCRRKECCGCEGGEDMTLYSSVCTPFRPCPGSSPESSIAETQSSLELSTVETLTKVLLNHQLLKHRPKFSWIVNCWNTDQSSPEKTTVLLNHQLLKCRPKFSWTVSCWNTDQSFAESATAETQTKVLLICQLLKHRPKFSWKWHLSNR